MSANRDVQQYDNHGHTVSSWIMAIGWLLGSAVTTAGFLVPSWFLGWLGAGVIVVGTFVAMAVARVHAHKEQQRASA